MKTEVHSIPQNNPRDPYGPPMVRFIVRVYRQQRPAYVAHITRSGYTFTRDPLHARTFSEREALKHAADLAIMYE
jgi:hypothetical protein